MPRLHIFCCPDPGEGLGIRVLSRGECLEAAPGVEVEDGQIRVRLQPAAPPPGAVEVRLIPDDESEYCNAGAPTLRFGRAVLRSPSGGTRLLLQEWVLVLRHPDHCRWLSTRATATGVGSGGPRDIGPIVMPAIPEGNARSLPVFPAAAQRTVVRLTSPLVVPGELLTLVWHFTDVPAPAIRRHDAGWLETPCLRGGRVVEVAGEFGAEDRRLLVQGHGGWVVCAASDHVPYTTGDWVFYSHVGSLCQGCEWWDTFMTVNLDTASGGSHTLPKAQPRPVLEVGMAPEAVILPLACGGHAAESPRFEPYVPSSDGHGSLGSVLDFCLRRGVVIQADANGTLSLEMAWGREDGVPVHYHCPGAETVDGGHTAFQPEDAVLVVSSRERNTALAVIGFADKTPRPCTEYIVISVSLPGHGGNTWYLVWDALAGGPARDLPDGHGEVLPASVFPCTREVLAYWLEQSRPVTVEDQMGPLLGAERLGFKDTVSQRVDSRPSPGRQCAVLACDPPLDCPTYAATLDGEALGGRCGVCQVEAVQDNPHAGRDTASHGREVIHVFEEEEGRLHDLRSWREEHPFLCCERQAAAPHPATSMRCVWGGFEDVIQVSRTYAAWREVRFATDGSENSLEFSETVTDRIAFPGVPHRSAFEWTDTTHVRRPLVSSMVSNPDTDAVREWVWNDRTVVVNGFGLRTHRSWLFAYVVIARRWWIEPYAAGGAVKQPHPGFDITVAAGSGSAVGDSLAGSPFGLSTDGALEAALTALLQAAYEDAAFTASSIHSEFHCAWEVRT